MDQALSHRLKTRLLYYSRIRGRFSITPEADAWYDTWYRSLRRSIAAEKQYAGYVERKPDHLHRIAMILTIAELEDDKQYELVLTLPKMLEALRILDWIEHFLPAAFSEMSQTLMGEESKRLLKQIKSAGGVLGHSEWLQQNTHRMNNIQFKAAVGTLREAKLVDWDAVKRQYYLTPEGFTK